MPQYNHINDITHAIIGSAFDTRNMYGRLMLESFYEKVMAIELSLKELNIKRQVSLDINHKGVVIPDAYFIDTVVNDSVAIEYKAVPFMGGEEFRQLETYLKLTGLKVGLLINFGAHDFTIGRFNRHTKALYKGIYRIANGVED